MVITHHQSEILNDKQYEVYTILANHKRCTVESIMTISNLTGPDIKNQLDYLLALGMIAKNKTNDRYRIKKMWKQSKMEFGDDNRIEKDFWVECNVCKQRLKNWVGSTPCCGSIAHLVEEDGTVSRNFTLFGSINNSPIKPLIVSNDSK